MSKSFPRATLTLVFFLSGVAGLGYQVVWGRWLHSVFGASSWALSAILSAFMAGLALGSTLAGRYGDRLKMDRLKAYGIAEVLIGLYALVLPFLLDAVVSIQGRFFFHLVEQHGLYGLIRFALCFVVLLVPTSLMGATFPLLSDYVARYSDAPARWAGLLYGLNTAGAVAGTLLAGFVMVASLGLDGSNYVLAAVNILVGAVAIVRAREEPDTPKPEKAPKKGKKKASESTADTAPIYGLIVGLFFVNGVFNLVYEVLWGRALALIIGTTTYAFSVMLGVFLTGIAAGSLWMTRRYESLKNPLRTLFVIQAFMVLWVLISPLLVNALPHLFLRGLWDLGMGWATSITLKSLLCVVLLLPLTLGMGAVFPLGIHLAFRRADGLAREVGDLYGINTAGAILGAFAGGFLIIPAFGVERGIAVTALLHLAAMAALVLRSAPARAILSPQRSRWIAVVVIAVILPMVARWNPLILASGVYFQPSTFYNEEGQVLLKERMDQVHLRYHAEGTGAMVDVLESPDGFRALAINGKSVATSSYYDYRLQRLLGALPLMLHPDPKRVLVIGMGTGMTSGTGSIDPATESLEIVEITGEVVGATEYFRQWNDNVVDKPITRVIVEDATHYLRFTDKRYEVITSDPIHPFVTGAGNLYSVESYEAALSKLTDGGVFCQWVPLYQLDDPDINSILRTFDEVWKNATVWVTGKDFIVCGVNGEPKGDFAVFKAKAEQEPWNEILRLLGFWYPEEVLSAYVGTLDDLREQFSDGIVNTVQRPHLEFSAPRAIFLRTDAAHLSRILSSASDEPPSWLRDMPAELPPFLKKLRPCTELIWGGFVADRQGDLGTATQLARQAFDLCPNLGYVRHFAAHTLDAYAGQIKAEEPDRALGLLRRARELDPYTPEIAAAIQALEGGS